MRALFCFWSVSSVGLEHRLDRAGVVGSNPIHSTGKSLAAKQRGFFVPWAAQSNALLAALGHKKDASAKLSRALVLLGTHKKDH